MVCISSTAAILGYCVVSILLGHNGLTRAAQGCRKQSADGQAQFDVSGETGNDSRAKCVANFGSSF